MLFYINEMCKYHWVPLMNLMVQYLSRVDDVDESHIRGHIEYSPNYKRRLILDNLHIVTSYFDARTINHYSI